MRAATTTAPRPLLLLVDDDQQIRQLLSDIGNREGFEVLEAADGAAALQMLHRRHMDLVLLDLHMPRVNGLEVLRAVRAGGTSSQIALMSGAASVEDAVEAIKLGATEYFSKPLDLPRVRALMGAMRQQFQDRTSVLDSDAALAARLEVCGMIGRSPAMRELFSVISRLAPHARTVLVTGETGTGKELVARALHTLGPRSAKRLITVNCSAVVETLFESELFGHVRGAFTGATADKTGVFEAANGGTVFLDEAGELPPGAQAKLLRTLENGELQRVGSVELKKVDVRVVAATNRQLDAEIAAGRFRSDLYYRLNVVEITVPPLRERPEDIPYLTAAFVRRFSLEFDKAITGLTEEAEERLVQWPWPGNVRELRNVIERACLLCEGHLLTEGDLARSLSERPAAVPVAVPDDEPVGPPPDADAVAVALDRAGGNKSLAARRLGISRRALYRLIDKYAPKPGGV
ncbi:MAG: sigma-54 dependent transcriptional regulator [Acidobacteriota bacterium]|nr:sigma-54 dependent transcriptional regulator [Acidobacteriota bacterium]